MATPGITVRPIKLIDGSYEVNEVFFEDVRVPVDQLVGQENSRMDVRKVPVVQRAHGNRPARNHESLVVRRQGRAMKAPFGGASLMDDPLFAARVAEIENELVALEITQLRVSGGGRRTNPTRPRRFSKLRGSQLQQAVTELMVEVAGAQALPAAEHSAEHYLNFRKTSIYGGSDEVQRSIISSTILGL